MSLECFQEVINDYEKLLESDNEYDVIIYTDENENVEEIHANSTILRTRSQYFRTAFSNKWAEKKDGKYIFKKPNISPQLFKMILRFIYCGKIDLVQLRVPEVLKLLIAVDELNIQTLIHHIQEYLIKKKHEFLQKNPTEILETVYQHEIFTDLWNFCLDKICGNPKMLFNSDEFINLKASLLELLLKRDDLSLNEIDVWDNLIKWCLAQYSNISQDVTHWNNKEVTIMRKTIYRFIPLIRFYQISSEDFVFKVYPFKELIPKDLINNLLVFHMAPNKLLDVDIQPPRKPNLAYDSVIIESQHFTIFASWIKKKNNSRYIIRNISYNFKLLYRASRDGNTHAAFHRKCDNKGATIVIAKIMNSKRIIGGYNPLFWDSSSTWKSTNDSFLFSFTNRNDFQSAKVGYCNNAEYAVHGASHVGPLFGRGHDLCYSGNNIWSSYQSTYPKIDGIPAGNFNVNDYEVFQVTKK